MRTRQESARTQQRRQEVVADGQNQKVVETDDQAKDSRSGRPGSRRRCSSRNRRRAAASRNAVAKITPAKKIGTKTTAHEATTLLAPGRARKSFIGTKALTSSGGQQQRSTATDAGAERPARKRLLSRIIVRIAKKTIELTIQVEPKSKRHVHHALGLQQHEARPQEEHLAVGPDRRTGAKTATGSRARGPRRSPCRAG